MKILFFIGSLNTGGAERQLSVLARGLSKEGHDIKVVTLFPGGQLSGGLIQDKSIDLSSLYPNKSKYLFIRLFQLFFSAFMLRRLLRDSDYLYSMLEVTNFIAWLATRFNKNIHLVWGIRSSNMEDHWKMALFEKICSWVSPRVKLVITNSHAGLNELIKRGYRAKKQIVINNGVDTEKFQFSHKSRIKIRDELNIPTDKLLVGIVARLNSMKDHITFLRAISLIKKEIDGVKFVCVGGGGIKYTKMLKQMCIDLGINGSVLWLGDRKDVLDIYSSLDLLVSSSAYGEGFSNVIGEAMSCGIPCVVTDAGDSKIIVGELGIVSPVRDIDQLSINILKMCDMIKNKLIDHALIRKRIKDNFSVNTLIIKTLDALNYYDK